MSVPTITVSSLIQWLVNILVPIICAILGWMANSVFDHESRISILEDRVPTKQEWQQVITDIAVIKQVLVSEDD